MILLVSATFAWMTMSASPTVTDLALYLVSDNNSAFLLANDINGVPGEYGLFLDLEESVPEDDALLKPISFSSKEMSFAIPRYGLDGRIASLNTVALVDATKTKLINSAALISSPAADSEELADCVYIVNFWVKAESTPCTVSLVSSFLSDQGATVDGTYVIGEPEWDTTKFVHKDSGDGAQYAVRIGFLISGTAENPDDYSFIIYEPNAEGGQAAADETGVYRTYAYDGSEQGLYSDKVKLVQQHNSIWKDTEPALKDTILYESGEFISEDKALMKLGAAEERRVTMFIWLEGQDPDCTNSIAAAKIIAHLQFSAKSSEDMPLRPD